MKRPIKASVGMKIDPAILPSLDEAASAAGMTRSALLEQLAVGYVRSRERIEELAREIAAVATVGQKPGRKRLV